MEVSKFYGGADPRDLPLYSQREAAHFISVSSSTLYGWTVRRSRIPGTRPAQFYDPLIAILDDFAGRLSFNNLVEAFVLNTYRKSEGVTIGGMRRALWFAENQYSIKRPLLSKKLCESGQLFWDDDGKLINLTWGGQLAMKAILEQYLNRIEWDEASDLPIRFFPIIPTNQASRSIVIDPRISFGQPTIYKKGIPTSVIAKSVNAEENLEVVAHDYGLEVDQVEEAVIYENIV